ncbi:MAG: arginine deiminase family protein [Xanthomonadales bacterium]|nr:arginine deiminase family protein [Xanthomonadales bacterium]
MPTQKTLPQATSEYGALKTVIMCMANKFDLNLLRLPSDLIDEASRHQAKHSSMRPYMVKKTRRQQQALIDVLEENGAEVLLVDPLGSGILQHYTRDVGFAIHDLFFVARPRRDYRKKELISLGPIVENFENVHHIKDGCIEGGDVFVDGNTVIIGQGEETSQEATDEVIGVLNARHPEIDVKRLTFTHRGIIHADTLFNIIGPNLAIIHRPSFIDEDIAWLSKRFELIDATDKEARSLSINTLAIGNGKLVMLAPGGRLADEVSKHGLEPILINYSEVTALPGSFRCTTLPVVRA